MSGAPPPPPGLPPTKGGEDVTADDDYVGDWRAELAGSERTDAEAAEQWGFTTDELEAALKVVGILRFKPEVFLEDTTLRTTGLWRWINRPPSMGKQAGKRVQQELFKHARNQRRRLMKEQDKQKLAKTEMRVARDEALNRLLTIDPDQQRALLIENEKGCELKITGAPDTQMITEAGETAEVAALIPSGAGGSDAVPTSELAESPGELNAPRKCHICKDAFTELHPFYYSLCKDCGVFNYEKRLQRRDLKGKVVIMTGARIKIGYQVCLKMLNDGATVIATTRFPQDAAKRFQQEPNYEDWKDRLHLHALDLRDLWSVKQFCRYVLNNVKSLFGIVHNAAQTIARPTEYYQHLIAGEKTTMQTPLIAPVWNDFVQKGSSAYTTGVQQKLEQRGEVAAPAPPAPSANLTNRITDEGTQLVTVNKPFYDMYDSMQEAQDRRTQNSWTADLHDVSAEEAAEVHAINALSPFIINSMLKPILVARPDDAAQENHFVINVSAMEGQFYRFKSTTHPHTNMAKASLNMMTRTSGRDYAQDRIYMNSVDTGWITDESPYEKQKRRLASQQLCPLDEIDAAARVLDLMYTDSTEHSKFWKDYHTIPW